MKPNRPSLLNRPITPITESEVVEIVASARIPEGETSINEVVVQRIDNMCAEGRVLTREAEIVVSKYRK
jgi:hypothetical protein